MNNYLSSFEAKDLFDRAKEASNNSYSPYSNFSVGAALITFDGQFYKGTDIENIAYTGTHAERVAIGNAIVNGKRNFKAISVYADVDTITPCGDCLQAIMEFGENIIVVFKFEGKLIQKKVGELLPFGFKTLK